MKYSLNIPLRIIIITFILISTCFSTNAFNLTFCTKYITPVLNPLPKDYASATWQIWMPDYGNISVGNAFYLIDSGADGCETKLTIVNVNDSSKNLLMTNTRTRLLQQNASGANTPLEIAVPPLAAPFMKFCRQFLFSVTPLDTIIDDNVSVSVTPIECNFPTSVEPNQVGNRSYK